MKLSKEAKELLREVIAAELPTEAERLSARAPETWLSAERSQMRDAIGHELARSGFDANWEPTARGRVLEDLIDVINRLGEARSSAS